MTQIISRDPAEVRGPFSMRVHHLVSRHRILLGFTSPAAWVLHQPRGKIIQRSIFILRRTALSSRRGRSNHLYTGTGGGIRNVRQPPAVYRRGPTGNTKYSVSPNQTYPYHLSTDDCWLRCVHHRRWRLIETNNTTLVGYTDWISSY